MFVGGENVREECFKSICIQITTKFTIWNHIFCVKMEMFNVFMSDIIMEMISINIKLDNSAVSWYENVRGRGFNWNFIVFKYWVLFIWLFA